MKISKGISNIIWICLCAVIAFSWLGNQSVYADSGNALPVAEIPAHFVYGSNGLSPSKAYQLILTPDDSASGGTAETPMPDGTVNDVSTISVSRSGGADYSFEIAYSRVGEYWYQVVLRDAGKQVLGTWQVHVTVYNGTDQAGSNALECAVALHQKTKTGDKTDQITAIDKNQPTPSTTVTPTPSITTTPTPGGASAQKSATNAKTGDSSNTRMWIITLSVSTALLLFFLAYLAGKQKRQKISKN